MTKPITKTKTNKTKTKTKTNTTRTFPMLAVVGVVSLLGLAACSSDNKLSVEKSNQSASTAAGDAGSGSDSGTSATTASGDGTVSVPDLSGVSIPGLAGACTGYLSTFASAISGQDTDLSGLSTLFDSLQGKVPSNVESAVKELSKDFAKLQDLYKKYDNDFTKAVSDPEFTKLFSDSGFASASATFNTWISSGCPES